MDGASGAVAGLPLQHTEASRATSYRSAGDGRLIRNGTLRSARALYRYFRSRGLASRSNPKLGDLVVWGRGTHIGIYVGKGKAISTLTRGVRVHSVFAVRATFTAYLHTGMSGSAASKTATSARTAAVQTKTSGTTATASRSVRRARGAVNLRRGASVQYARILTLASDTRLVVSGKRVDARGRTRGPTRGRAIRGRAGAGPGPGRGRAGPGPGRCSTWERNHDERLVDRSPDCSS